jgi:hypothetical protein
MILALLRRERTNNKSNTIEPVKTIMQHYPSGSVLTSIKASKISATVSFLDAHFLKVRII